MLSPRSSFVHVQEQIALLTELPAERQLILLAHKELTKLVAVNEQVQSYPRCIKHGQLFVYERENFEINKAIEPKHRK